MGLFDNLFKNKPEPGEEAVVEAARRITETEKARLVEAEKASKAEVHRTPGSGNRAAHAPVARAYSPRSLGQTVPPRHVSSGTRQVKPVRFGAGSDAGRPQEICLVLDDVLPRIPSELLNDERRDGRKQIRLRVEDVTADIARGRAAVALGRIAEQAPEIFKQPVSPGDDTLIRLPLQKLVEQIGFLPVTPPPSLKQVGPAPLPPPALLPSSASGAAVVPLVSSPATIETAESSFSTSGTTPVAAVPPETSAPPPGTFIPNSPDKDTEETQLESFEAGASRTAEATTSSVKEGEPLGETHTVQPVSDLSAPTASTDPVPEIEAVGESAASDNRELLEPDVSPLGSSVLPSATDNTSAEPSESTTPDAGKPPVQEFASKPNSDAEQPIESGSKEGQDEQPVPVLPAEPSLDVPAPVLASPEISLSAPAALSEAEPETILEAATAPKLDPNQPDARLSDPEVASPKSLASLPAPVPPVIATFLPPPIPGGASTLEATLENASGEPQSAATFPLDAPPAPPRFIPPPVHLTPPLKSLFSTAASVENTERLTPAPDLQGETRKDSAASPFVSPPAFPVPPRPVLPPADLPDSRETHIGPPPSPILPVRIVSPLVLRPVVAPPPLFGAGTGEDQPILSRPAQTPVSEPIPEQSPPSLPPPLPPPPPPRPLELQKARHALGLGDEAPLSAIGEALTSLPALEGCLLAVRHETADVGTLPQEIDREWARALGARLAESLTPSEDRVCLGSIQHVTVFASDGCMSVFARGNALICAFHRTRAFLPGVREKLLAIVETLADA